MCLQSHVVLCSSFYLCDWLFIKNCKYHLHNYQDMMYLHVKDLELTIIAHTHLRYQEFFYTVIDSNCLQYIK